MQFWSGLLVVDGGHLGFEVDTNVPMTFTNCQWEIEKNDLLISGQRSRGVEKLQGLNCAVSTVGLLVFLFNYSFKHSYI
jgi:hypothetical protein